MVFSSVFVLGSTEGHVTETILNSLGSADDRPSTMQHTGLSPAQVVTLSRFVIRTCGPKSTEVFFRESKVFLRCPALWFSLHGHGVFGADVGSFWYASCSAGSLPRI